MYEQFRLKPVSKWFGFDRGTPIDRYYMEKFLDENKELITGDVLEIGDDRYTKKFGRNVKSSAVLDIQATERATFVGNLESGENVPECAFDCIIMTQVIQVIYDVHAALRNSLAALKPNGSLLITASGISPIWIDDIDTYQEHWRFTDQSLQKIMCEHVHPEEIEVKSYGNLAVAKAFLDGYALEDLPPEILEHHDYQFQLLLSARVTKSDNG